MILAVHPANQDIACSDGLLLAREADPDHIRTMTALTKMDLCDNEDQTCELLKGSIIP